MTVRKGASLINIMVFVMFAMMVTAQVFFFTATSIESLSEEREIMSYRLMLDSIVRTASNDLALNGKIVHNYDRTENVTADYESFYGSTQVIDRFTNISWDISDYTDKYHATIHDLDYTLKTATPLNTSTWENLKNNGRNMFASMPAISDDIGTEGSILRYYLLRAYAELPRDKFYGRKLMYQVLFRRIETPGQPHRPEIKSFQEIWF